MSGSIASSTEPSAAFCATSSAAVGWHHSGADVILILVILHVGMIAYYRIWKREDLVAPMFTGWKTVMRDDRDHRNDRDDRGRP